MNKKNLTKAERKAQLRAEQMQKKFHIENFEKSLSINKPKLASVVFAVIWTTLLFIISILMHYSNKMNDYVFGLNVVSYVGIFIALIWCFIHFFGVFEKLFLRFKNMRIKQLMKLYHVEKYDKWDLEKYREYSRKKSLLGAIVLASIWTTILIITIIIQYTR